MSVMLTNNTLKEFEKWYNSNYKDIDFNKIPFSFKWGVYLEFFDYLGIPVYVAPYYDKKMKKVRWGGFNKINNITKGYDNRDDAQKEVINRNDILYNDFCNEEIESK